MEIGVGLPAAVPRTQPAAIMEWSRRIENGPFASVGVVDRIAYDNYEPIVSLSAAAAVTRRVELVTSILISPLREITSLAKQLVSLDALSMGRLTVGVAIGARGEDHRLSEFRDERRGDRLTRQLSQLRELWAEGRLTPSAAIREAPPLLVGGSSGPGFARMARLSEGYIHGGGPPRAFAKAADQAAAAWADIGRTGSPTLYGQGYFALGEAEEEGRTYMLDYYAFAGAFAQRIADGLLTSPLQIREFIDGYAAAGCDQLILMPAVADPKQIDLLADAVS